MSEWEPWYHHILAYVRGEKAEEDIPFPRKHEAVSFLRELAKHGSNPDDDAADRYALGAIADLLERKARP